MERMTVIKYRTRGGAVVELGPTAVEGEGDAVEGVAVCGGCGWTRSATAHYWGDVQRELTAAATRHAKQCDALG